MTDQFTTAITKSDFLLYCDAPRHLWAKKHGKYVEELSEFQQHLIEDGSTAEGLGKQYFSSAFLHLDPGSKLLWQETVTDGPFEARIDALVYKPASNSVDLYEIKSSTGVDKENVYDVTFQAIILEKHFTVDTCNILHLNKEYILSGALDLGSLFVVENITDKVRKLMPELLRMREDALRAAQKEHPEDVQACFSPKTCPCPESCHPDLPEFSIYDIPHLSRDKKTELVKNGIRAARDIPLSFSLNKKQRLIAECARTNTEHVDRDSLLAELERFQYPLWFLDYETCISAIPLYAGYHPQQQVVFQYSLHLLDRPGEKPKHFGHLSTGPGDPASSLLEHLSTDLGPSGTVIVWNKTFEMTRNKELAIVHPKYATFLDDVNARIYDLGDIVNYGYYLHPRFKGSWSIKDVLPVMVKELTYEGLELNQGDQASVAWWSITFGDLGQHEKEVMIENLEKYCQLDTLAMVEIFRKFESISRDNS